MYHEVGVQALSPKQVSRILNGHAVRVKMGSGHKMHVSTEHAKKLHRAHMKGSAVTVVLDPYAIEKNQHLRTHVGRVAHKARTGGTALIDQPFTTRQAVDTSGKFIKDPAKTLGFGARKGLPAKYKGSGPKGLKKFQKWTGAIGDFLKPVAKPILGALTDQAVNNINAYGEANAMEANPYGAVQGLFGSGKKGGTALIDQPFTTRQAVNTIGSFVKDPAKTIGFGAKKSRPKRVMSEAQKQALAKGRHALRLKLEQMGAGRHQGKALQPAGYGVDVC